MATKTHITKQEEVIAETGVQSRASDPGSPVSGQTWINTADARLRHYDGASTLEIGGGGLSKWATGEAYAVDEIVYTDSGDANVDDGDELKIWKCITANSDATFNSANWEEISAGGSSEALSIETKILSANVTASSKVADLSFTGLVVGKRYLVTGDLLIDNAGDPGAFHYVDFYDASTDADSAKLKQRLILSRHNVASREDTQTVSFVYEATSTELSCYFVNVNGNPRIRGNSSMDQTFINVTELPITTGGSNNTNWVDAGAITVGATTTAPTKSSNVTIDRAIWRREGPDALIRFEFSHTNNSGAADGSGDYLFTLPAGLVADTSLVSAFSDVVGVVSGGSFDGVNMTNTLGTCSFSNDGNAGTGNVVLYDSTRVRLIGPSWVTDSAGNIGGAVGSGFFSFSSFATGEYQFVAEFRVPISGWSA